MLHYYETASTDITILRYMYLRIPTLTSSIGQLGGIAVPDCLSGSGSSASGVFRFLA